MRGLPARISPQLPREIPVSLSRHITTTWVPGAKFPPGSSIDRRSQALVGGTHFAVNRSERSRIMSSQIQKIVVPMDFSDVSERAALYAESVARALGATLYLVHVQPPAALARHGFGAGSSGE